MIPFNDKNKALIHAVADDLLGTCQTLDTVLQRHFGEDAELMLMDTELLRTLDDCTMECMSCGWWCETHEFNTDDEQICDECARDRVGGAQ